MDDTATRDGVVMRTEERAAFDLWLNRSLIHQHEQVLREPVPDELLRLVASLPIDPRETRH